MPGLPGASARREHDKHAIGFIVCCEAGRCFERDRVGGSGLRRSVVSCSARCRDLDVAINRAGRNVKGRIVRVELKRILGNARKRQVLKRPARIAVAHQALGLQILMAENQSINGLRIVELVQHRAGDAGGSDIIVARSVDVRLQDARLEDIDPIGNEDEQIAVSGRELKRDQLELCEARKVMQEAQTIAATNATLGLHDDVLRALHAVLILRQIRPRSQERVQLTAGKVSLISDQPH